MSCGTIPKFMKHTISVRLLHLGMDVIARITQLSNLFGEKLDSINRIAKNDALVNFKLRKQGVQTVDLLSFFDVCIKLRNTAESKLIHEVDTVWIGNVLLAKSFHCDWECCAKQTKTLKNNDQFDPKRC